MSRAALLRADAGRADPLGAAGDILARAALAGRPLSVFERSQVRAAVRQHEAQAGESLIEAIERLLAADDRENCARLLDIAEALHPPE